MNMHIGCVEGTWVDEETRERVLEPKIALKQRNEVARNEVAREEGAWISGTLSLCVSLFLSLAVDFSLTCATRSLAIFLMHLIDLWIR